MSRRKWTIASYDKKRAIELAAECGIDELVTLILNARGYTEPFELEEFLSADAQLSDPHTLPDMDKAVRRIRAAVDGFEKIAVYGDYDADGVCATAILYSYLSNLNANVLYYIPERAEEGYGMNIPSIEKLKDEGVSLIVTVDNGVSAESEVSHAKTLGIDVVVTDHHLPPSALPDAAAIVDPHLKGRGCPYPDICGAVVAFKLVCALEGCECEELLDEYGDLAAIGTAADIMPLTGENRVIVRRGLSLIRRAPRPGIAALLEQAGAAGKRLNASTLGFVIGPRINAAGRMGRSDRAARLLLGPRGDETADIAREIGEENARRQQVEAEIFAKAKASVFASGAQFDKIIVAAGEDWHPGVVGIVASRMAEFFGRPAIVLSVSGDIAVGSGRSVRGFSLYDALCAAREALTVFGGHELAGGMTLSADKIDDFRKALNDWAADIEMPWPALSIDCKINPKFITLDTVWALSPLEPYGSGNPAPLFCLLGMKVEGISPLAGGKHVKLTVSRDGENTAVLCFGRAAAEFPFLPGDLVDLAVALEASEYRGETAVSIIARDIRLSGQNEDALLHSMRRYEALRRGSLPKDEAAALVPGREELAAVYRALRACPGQTAGPGQTICTGQTVCFEVLAHRQQMEYAKLRVILDILAERGLIGLELLTPETARAAVLAVSGKVDLEASPVLKSLRAEG